VLWIGLNPSTADASEDDQTIRRMISFSKREGYSRMVVCNLFSLITPYPAELWLPRADLLSRPENLLRLVQVARKSELVIACWGAEPGGRVEAQAATVTMHLADEGCEVHCLGRTKSGRPRHPSRLAKDTPLAVLSYGRLSAPQAVRSPLRLVR
jgi:hypothetical protein